MNLPKRNDALNHKSHDIPAKVTAVPVLANERELPVGWKWLAMSDICFKVQDGTHFSPKEQFASGVYKYITAKNIKTWGLDLSELTYVSELFHREIYKRCNPEKGDILYIKDGVTTGIATVNTLDEAFSLLSSVALLKPRREIIDPYFLKYYLNSPEGFRRMTGQMTGTAIKRLILQKIKQARVPVAPLPEQRRIVSEVEKQFTRLDAGVASLKRVQAVLKRYRASVLKSACEGRLVPTEAELARREGRSYEPAAELLDRILAERRARWESNDISKLNDTGRTLKDGKRNARYEEPARPETSQLPTIPNGWTWATMPQLGELNRGKSKHRPRDETSLYGGPYPFIQTGDIRRSRGTVREHHQTYSEIGLQQSRLWPAGTLCITIAANIAETGILTYPACFPDSVVGFLNDAQPTTVRYVELFLRTAKEKLDRLAPATAQKNINLEVLSKVAIAIPPFAEQQRIVAEVERRFSVIDELEMAVTANLKRAERLHQSILHRAFTGNL